MKDNQFKKERLSGIIRIGTEMFTVTGKEYSEYYAELERWKYIKRTEKGKKLSYEKAIEDGVPIAMLSATTPVSVEDEAENNIFIEQLKEALTQLDEADKRLIQMLFFDGFSCRKIARRLNVGESTIRYRRDRILKLLRKALRV